MACSVSSFFGPALLVQRLGTLTIASLDRSG
jgi:hypothetical protein